MKADAARSPWLALGGTASSLAAALHLACIAGGSSRYLALGASGSLAQ